VSRLGERLQRLHKVSKPIGFGFGSAVVTPRRMLLLIRISGVTGEDLGAVLGLADAAILGHEKSGDHAMLQEVVSRCGGDPVGVAVATQGPLPVDPAIDFFVCDLDGPFEAITQKEQGCIVQVDSGLEASRLRAIAELGVDALVLRSESLDLTRLSSVVECRRIHIISGKPLVLSLEGRIQPVQVGAFWRVGVDALLVDSALDLESLTSIRDSVNNASYESRLSEAGTFAAIGPQMSALGHTGTREDDEGDGEEEDDDE